MEIHLEQKWHINGNSNILRSNAESIWFFDTVRGLPQIVLKFSYWKKHYSAVVRIFAIILLNNVCFWFIFVHSIFTHLTFFSNVYFVAVLSKPFTCYGGSCGVRGSGDNCFDCGSGSSVICGRWWRNDDCIKPVR